MPRPYDLTTQALRAAILPAAITVAAMLAIPATRAHAKQWCYKNGETMICHGRPDPPPPSPDPKGTKRK